MRHTGRPRGTRPRSRPDPTHPPRSPRADAGPTRPTGPAGAHPGSRTTPTPPRPTHCDTPPIPATVWLCGQATDEIDQPWTEPALAKVITAFTDPGAHLALLTWPHPEAEHPATDRPILVGSDLRPAGVRRVAQDLGRTTRLIHSTPGPLRAPSASRPPDLAGDPATAADTAHAPGAHLVLTWVGPEHCYDRACEHIASTAAAQLHTGGVLAVLTHTDWADGHLLDPTGPIVTAAQNADLLYLQHIVLIHAPVCDGHFVIPPVASGDRHAERRTIATPAHRRIHTDLLAFAQPRDHHPLPLPPAAIRVRPPAPGDPSTPRSYPAVQPSGRRANPDA